MALSRFCQYLVETCKLEATAEACFEINHSEEREVEITSSALFGTKSGRNLTRSLCQTKKPVLTTSSNQLTNKDINGYGIS